MCSHSRTSISSIGGSNEPNLKKYLVLLLLKKKKDKSDPQDMGDWKKNNIMYIYLHNIKKKFKKKNKLKKNILSVFNLWKFHGNLSIKYASNRTKIYISKRGIQLFCSFQCSISIKLVCYAYPTIFHLHVRIRVLPQQFGHALLKYDADL